MLDGHHHLEDDASVVSVAKTQEACCVVETDDHLQGNRLVTFGKHCLDLACQPAYQRIRAPCFIFQDICPSPH